MCKCVRSAHKPRMLNTGQTEKATNKKVQLSLPLKASLLPELPGGGVIQSFCSPFWVVLVILASSSRAFMLKILM